MTSTTVLIRTLDLHVGNYGGMLQAYALQEVLRSLGCSPVTDTSSRPVDLSLSDRLKALVRYTVGRVPLLQRVRPRWASLAFHSITQQSLMKFLDEKLTTVQLFDREGRLGPDAAGIIHSADAFLVGSDQVWRRKYSDVTSYLFDFLADTDRPIISYAASFGCDDLSEYSPELISRSALLAHRFRSISVREASGVRLCQDHWNVAASVQVDPTMLLDASHYLHLAGLNADAVPPTGLVTYLLDPSENTLLATAAVEKRMGARAMSLLPEPAPSLRAVRQDPPRYIFRSIGDWLASIAGADYFLTDSFHGTVFALLNHRPFAVLPNYDRGVARITELLRPLGLESRLACTPKEASELIRVPIDWSPVDAALDQRRTAGIEFLRSALCLGE